MFTDILKRNIQFIFLPEICMWKIPEEDEDEERKIENMKKVFQWEKYQAERMLSNWIIEFFTTRNRKTTAKTFSSKT